MVENKPLLAKSIRTGKPPVTLEEHLRDTEKAAYEIFRLDKRWGQNWCRFFKIYDKVQQEKFLLNVRIAALFHDIGKANEDFQKAVSQNGFYQQTIRHEHLSALILHLPEVRKWLSDNKDLDLEVITAAVLSHHIKAIDKDGHDYKWMQPKGSLVLKLNINHDEVQNTFNRIREIAKFSNAPQLNLEIWSKYSPWAEAENDGKNTAIQFGRKVKPGKDEGRLGFLLAVKAGLIAADAVSSGLVREGENIDEWINEKVHREAISNDEIFNEIIKKRAWSILGSKALEQKKLEIAELITSGQAVEESFNTKLWSDFQKSSASLGKLALLLAACGAGKTIAAWIWALAISRSYSIGKVIFLYPTRGTATEGFKDYVGFAPETEASLLHGTSEYELEGIAENPNEATKDKDYSKETNDRLFALGFWGKRYFSATVDQFLSFLENNYSSICMLPVLADAAIIIDEVHSFDKHMFESLICFLKQFDVPVLCMTATLPPSRKENLANAGLRVYPSKDEQKKLNDLNWAEKRPRYNLEILTQESATDRENEVLKIAVDEFNAGKRVLWVVNTVKRCQSLALRFKKLTGIEPIVYHSRYTTGDRKIQHEATVNAFKQLDEAKIAITTQVCEMSLDLDADVLITEIAPITSLVQRFGRSNRHLARGLDFRSRLVAYMPENDKPYNQKDDLDPATAFLKDLPVTDISQRVLAEKLEEHVKRERHHDGDFAPFLNGGYFAVPGPGLRDTDELTEPCVLLRDIDKVKQRLREKRTIDEFVIGVPKNKENLFTLSDIELSELNVERPKDLPRYLNVANSRFYRTNYGFITDPEILQDLEIENE
ncbi:MAG: CRISPR-associated helicase Cas3' [Acidobacteria bacterium]|nr:CRISPR-associated helicase Cas3' [Acidobacteriota bacterium]